MSIRCDSCGRFMSFKDIELGYSKVRMVTPSSVYSSEEFEHTCKDCSHKNRSYVIYAYRWGDINAHNYLVGTSKYEYEACELAQQENWDRARKYGIIVYETYKSKKTCKSFYYPSQWGEESLYESDWKFYKYDKIEKIFSFMLFCIAQWRSYLNKQNILKLFNNKVDMSTKNTKFTWERCNKCDSIHLIKD